MKLELRRGGLVIIPESAQDTAFIEDTLGLTAASTVIGLVRVDTVKGGMFLTTRRDPPKSFDRNGPESPAVKPLDLIG